MGTEQFLRDYLCLVVSEWQTSILSNGCLAMENSSLCIIPSPETQQLSSNGQAIGGGGVFTKHKGSKLRKAKELGTKRVVWGDQLWTLGMISLG